MALLKQKRAFKKVLNGMPITRAMREAGYAESTAQNTGKLTRSVGWQELMDQYLPEELLIKVENEGLRATKFTHSFTEQDQLVPDYPTRHKYLETGLKMRGKLQQTDGGTTNNIYIENLRIEQQRKLASEVLRITESGTGSSDSISDSDEPAV